MGSDRNARPDRHPDPGHDVVPTSPVAVALFVHFCRFSFRHTMGEVGP